MKNCWFVKITFISSQWCNYFDIWKIFSNLEVIFYLITYLIYIFFLYNFIQCCIKLFYYFIFVYFYYAKYCFDDILYYYFYFLIFFLINIILQPQLEFFFLCYRLFFNFITIRTFFFKLRPFYFYCWSTSSFCENLDFIKLFLILQVVCCWNSAFWGTNSKQHLFF